MKSSSTHSTNLLLVIAFFLAPIAFPGEGAQAGGQAGTGIVRYSTTVTVDADAAAATAKRSIARANAALDKCAIVPGKQRYKCVSDAFSDVSTSIAQFRSYFKAFLFLREAADKVGATGIVSVAVSALEKAQKRLLRSISGVEKQQQGNYKDLSKLMARAKSVLRA